MVLSLSPSRVFSGIGNTATGLPLRLGLHSYVVFSSAAPASFSMRQRGEGGGGTQMFVLFHLPECMALSFIVLSGVYIAYSVF